MNFYARENELEAINNLYNKDSFEMLVVYGRRRVGKTAILNEFVKDKNNIFFTAQQVNDSLNLKKFSRIVCDKLGLSSTLSFDSWNDLFIFIKEQFSKEKLVLVIDEYPYALKSNLALNSILQNIIDYEFKNANILLILCGSSMSLMENEVLAEKSPLFGRRTAQIKINPLNYYDASMFYKNVSNEDKIKYYATIGGTPYYLNLINPKLSFEDNIKELYFSISGYLMNEGILLMKQEFNEPSNYNAILQAIACGYVSLNEIVNFTNISTNLVSKYLIILQNLNFIKKTYPFDSNPMKYKKNNYVIVENFIAFWYRYVFSYKSEIENGNGKIYAKNALSNLNEYIGPIFEDITRQYLSILNAKNKLPFIGAEFGKWWGKAYNEVHEIDVIVRDIDKKELIVGECKWTNTINTNKVIDNLILRANIFSDYKTYLYLFTKKKVDLGIDDIINISIDDYYKL